MANLKNNHFGVCCVNRVLVLSQLQKIEATYSIAQIINFNCNLKAR